MHDLPAPATFFAFLTRLDQDLAQPTHDHPCTRCGATLHSADYPRSPRGLPPGVDPCLRRFSFCCSAPDCRKRHTPPSLRFAGRRWYLAHYVLIATALAYAPSPGRHRRLRRLLVSGRKRDVVELG